MYKTPRRGILEMRLDILKAISKGREKTTKIVYKSNVSWVTLKESLEFMEKKGLITSEIYGFYNGNPRKKYYITQKGIDIINTSFILECLR